MAKTPNIKVEVVVSEAVEQLQSLVGALRSDLESDRVGLPCTLTALRTAGPLADRLAALDEEASDG